MPAADTYIAMTLHYNSRLCPKGYAAITLFGHVFFRLTQEQCEADYNHKYCVNHERIHVMQGERDGWARFYFRYAWDYLRLRLQGWNHRSAYRLIPYEVEAYAHQNDLDYGKE